MRESERFEQCEWHCDNPLRGLFNACDVLRNDGRGPELGRTAASRDFGSERHPISLCSNQSTSSLFSSNDGLWKLDMAIIVACRCLANLSAELPPMRRRLGSR